MAILDGVLVEAVEEQGGSVTGRRGDSGGARAITASAVDDIVIAADVTDDVAADVAACRSGPTRRCCRCFLLAAVLVAFLLAPLLLV